MNSLPERHFAGYVWINSYTRETPDYYKVIVKANPDIYLEAVENHKAIVVAARDKWKHELAKKTAELDKEVVKGNYRKIGKTYYQQRTEWISPAIDKLASKYWTINPLFVEISFNGKAKHHTIVKKDFGLRFYYGVFLKKGGKVFRQELGKVLTKFVDKRNYSWDQIHKLDTVDSGLLDFYPPTFK